jgi:transcriptional regulator with XRE-family HTH domain
VDIAEKLKKIMKERGFTQTSLAEAADISQNAIWKIVKGKTQSPQKLPEICHALGMSVDDFLNYGNSTTEDVDSFKTRVLRKVQAADPNDLPEIEKLIDAIASLRRQKKNAGLD